MGNLYRFHQVVKFGWLHAGKISHEAFGDKKRVSLFFDILGCYRKYGMWSNQYMNECFWMKEKDLREKIGEKYYKENKKREDWVKDFYANRGFLAKWSKYEIEADARKREQRNRAYIEHYRMGKECVVEYGVELSRQHHLPGTIKIGNHVTLAKHVFIDYTGEVIIRNNVKIANGVNIETHSHTSDGLSTDSALKCTIPTKLLIEDCVSIGAHAIILETCNKIGRGARIGAGSVVRTDIPPYAVVIGNPAKIVGFVFSPGMLEEFEEEKYLPEDRISIEEYEKNYKKYYLDRLKEIGEFLK